jgi:hypothetical protein
MSSLVATSVGSKIPLSNFVGKIIDIHDHAFNVELVDSSISTCASCNYFNMPHGNLVNSQIRDLQAYFKTGTTVNHRNGILRFSSKTKNLAFVAPQFGHQNSSLNIICLLILINFFDEHPWFSWSNILF